MEWLHPQACPLCGSERFSLFREASKMPGELTSENFRITDSRYGQHWRFSRCLECGFVFADPIAPPNVLIRWYESLQDMEYGEECENRAKNFLPILRKLKKMNPEAKRILDIGAASGIFMDLARKHGYEVEGVEPSVSLVTEAREHYGLDIFNGTLDRFPKGKPFDAVMMLDILEHVHDPMGLIGKAAARLKPGGLIIAVTPDIASPAARLAGNRWWHFRIAHIHFFTPSSLRWAFQSKGFEILKTSRYAWHFSIYYLLTRIFPGLKRSGALQTQLKKLHLKVQLFDSLEIYARKTEDPLLHRVVAP